MTQRELELKEEILDLGMMRPGDLYGFCAGRAEARAPITLPRRVTTIWIR